MSCPNAANVNIQSFPPGECLPVEGCPGGPPVEVTGPDGAPVDVTFPTPVPVTIADCADVAQGCVNDARSGAGDQPGTVNAHLRQLCFLGTEADGFVAALRDIQPVADMAWRQDLGAYTPVRSIDDQNLGAYRTIGLTGSLSTAYWKIEGFVGPFPLWVVPRSPREKKTAQAVAAGNTALWVPTAATRFRLMKYMVQVTEDATLAAPGVLTISLFDGAAGPTGQAHDVWVPAAALALSGNLYTSPWIDLDEGYLSVAQNNVLNINLSAALLTGNVRILCCGTEEP